VNFLREYNKRDQIAPMIKILVKKIGDTFGPAKGNLKYLYELYTEGPAKQACKIACFPRPSGCV
jgi:tRNA 2-thiouridine synthesizing protein E